MRGFCTVVVEIGDLYQQFREELHEKGVDEIPIRDAWIRIHEWEVAYALSRLNVGCDTPSALHRNMDPLFLPSEECRRALLLESTEAHSSRLHARFEPLSRRYANSHLRALSIGTDYAVVRITEVHRFPACSVPSTQLHL